MPRGTLSMTDSFTCASRNLIYAIVCKRCDLVYIGETGRTLSTRFCEHLEDVAMYYVQAMAQKKSTTILERWQYKFQLSFANLLQRPSSPQFTMTSMKITLKKNTCPKEQF